MSRIFITGSTDGLGLMAAGLLVKDGHRVTLHARNQARGADARNALPGAEGLVIGDLSGEYVYHQQARHSHPAARDPSRQDALLNYCAALTATPLPDL